MAGVGHCDAAGCEQKDAFADALLMTIDGEGATGDEINSTLGRSGSIIVRFRMTVLRSRRA